MTYQFAVEIARDESARSSDETTYSVRFHGAGDELPGEQLRRCRSDYALLRLIEELLTAPQARLELLERLRAESRASIPRVILTEPQVTRYALGDLPASRATDPMCPVCLRSVNVVDRVVFRQGDAIHDECRVRARDMVERSRASWNRPRAGRSATRVCRASSASDSTRRARSSGSCRCDGASSWARRPARRAASSASQFGPCRRDRPLSRSAPPESLPRLPASEARAIVLARGVGSPCACWFSCCWRW